MKIGMLLYHPEYGVVTISKKHYSPSKNKVVWYIKDDTGTERELSGQEIELTEKETDRFYMIQGKDGDDGYNPVKGKDYFTPDEIEEFKRRVTPKKGSDYKDGKDGEKGEKGDKGDKGDTPLKNVHYFDGKQGLKGDKPKHKWEGTQLAFEKPDGTWGKFVDLKGKDGLNGMNGGGSGGSFNAQTAVSSGDRQPGYLEDKIIAGTNITITKSSDLNETLTISATGSSYTLPTASGSVLGGVKVGTRLSIDGSGVLSADVQTTEQSRSFVITNPTASSDLPLWRVPVGITITAVHLLCKGNVTVGQLWQYDSNGLNGATVDSSQITGIVDTNVNDDGTLSAPSITAGNYLGWKTDSVTGTPTYAIVSFDYTIT